MQQWFIAGAEPTAYGTHKDQLFPSDADSPIGDCEFFFARATDNPYVSKEYVEQTLGGLPRQLRRRLLEGLWEFTTGTCFFTEEALVGLSAAGDERGPAVHRED